MELCRLQTADLLQTPRMAEACFFSTDCLQCVEETPSFAKHPNEGLAIEPKSMLEWVSPQPSETSAMSCAGSFVDRHPRTDKSTRTVRG